MRQALRILALGGSGRGDAQGGELDNMTLLAKGHSSVCLCCQLYRRFFGMRGAPPFAVKHCLHFSICACHPCAGAMLIVRRERTPQNSPTRIHTRRDRMIPVQDPLTLTSVQGDGSK